LKTPIPTLLIWLIFLVVVIFAPFFLPRYYVAVLTNVLCWLGLALCWHFFSGTTKYISLGSAAFFGVGVYLTAIFGKTLPYYFILPLACVINFLFAGGVGLVTLRLRGMYFAIFTFGLAELLNNIILFWEMKVTGTRGRFVTPFDIYYPMVFITFGIILLTLVLRKSKFGLALRMIGENEEAAAHFGLNTTLYKILGFALSSALIGVIGAAFAPRWGYIDSGIAFNPLYSFMPAVMTLFGGTETMLGPVVGALLLSLVEEYLLTVLKEYFMLILGLVMIIILLTLPEGITGRVVKR